MDHFNFIVQGESKSVEHFVAFSVPVAHGTCTINVEDNSNVKYSNPGEMTVEKSKTDKSKSSLVTQELHGLVNSKSRKSNGISRVRSASAGRDGRECTRARHWSYLFDNLKRAVDEIYQTCEKDESIIECREAVMILENYNREFHGLIDWFKLKRQISESGDKSQKPIAWEIRKSTPSRIIYKDNQNTNHMLTQSLNEIKCEKASMKAREHLSDDLCLDLNDLNVSRTFDSGSNELTTKTHCDNEIGQNLKEKLETQLNENIAHQNVVETQIEGETSEFHNLSETPLEFPIDKNESKSLSVKASKIYTAIMNDASTNVNLEDPLSPDSLELKSLSGTIICPSKTCLASLKLGMQSESNTKLKLPYSEVSKQLGSICVNMCSSDQQNCDDKNFSKACTLNSTNPAPIKSSALKQSKHFSMATKLGKSESCLKTCGNDNKVPKDKSWSKRMFNGLNADSLSMKIKPQLKIKLPVSSCNTNRGYFSKGKEPFLHESNPLIKKVAEVPMKPEEDEDGWKTVRSRTRSRYSLGLNHSHSNLSTINANISNCAHKGVTLSQRFDIPSGAKSLPTLALVNEDVIDSNGMKKLNIKKVKSKAHHSLPTEAHLFHNESCLDSKQSLPDTLAHKSGQCHLEMSKKTCSKRVLKSAGSGDVSISDSESLADEEEMKRHELALESVEQQEHNLEKEIMETEDSKIEIDTENSENETEDIDESKTYQDLGVAAKGKENSRMDLVDDEIGRQPGRALHLHEKLSSPFRKRTLDETFKRHQEKQAKAQVQREKMLREKSMKLKELFKKINEVRATKEQILAERKRTIDRKQKRAEEKRQRHLREIVRKAHDEEEKAKEIAFINELEAQNKRHDIMDLHQSAEARLAEREEERQQRQEARAAKEAAAEERRRLIEEERKARFAEMLAKSQKRFEKHERQLRSRKQEQIEAAREKQRDREERRCAREAADAASKEELQKKIQQKQEESARRHEENIEQIRQRAFELSIMRGSSASDDPPHLVPYETKKICTLCNILIGSEVYLLSHLKSKRHQEALKDLHSGEYPTFEDLNRYNIKHIVDAPADKIDPFVVLDKERQKALKKKCKKLKQRMTSRGQEFENRHHSKNTLNQQSPKVFRILREIIRIKSSQGIGPWPPKAVLSIDRAFGDLSRLFDKSSQEYADKTSFRCLSGFELLSELLESDLNTKPDIPSILPAKCLYLCCNTYRLACDHQKENSSFIVGSNLIVSLIDVLAHRLSIFLPGNGCRLWRGSPTTASCLPVDCIVSGLLILLATILQNFTGFDFSNESLVLVKKEDIWNRLQDIISYIVGVGIVDKLAIYFNAVHGPIDDEPQVVELLVNSLAFLTSSTKLIASKYLYTGLKRPEDPTQLLATLQVTELAGTISMLYGMLIRQDLTSRGGSPTPPLVEGTLNVTKAVIQLLLDISYVDLTILQIVLGSEGISLEFRHITSFLLRYCSISNDTDLLHDVIRVVGYFTVGNHDNQLMVQLGQTPTVLQQLCNLPFPYFSNTQLTNILFPTLLASCYLNEGNRKILEQEMSFQLLEDFLELPHSQDIHLIKVLLSRSKTEK